MRSREYCRSAAIASAFGTSRINGASSKGTSNTGRRRSSATASAPTATVRKSNPTSLDAVAQRVGVERVQQIRAVGVLRPTARALAGFVLEEALISDPRPACIVLRLERPGAQDVGEEMVRDLAANRVGLGE